MPGPVDELDLEGVSITGGKEEAELSMGWVNLQVGLDCTGLDCVKVFCRLVGWLGSWVSVGSLQKTKLFVCYLFLEPCLSVMCIS